MIQVNSNSSTPIYEQIQSGLKDLIFRKVLRDGDKLPSVRELACNLTVNPNTISKAYNQLEKEGLIQTLKGKGTFIKKDAQDIVKSINIDNLRSEITNILLNAIKLDLTLEDIIKLEKEVYVDLEVQDNVRD
ncbi:GntR family transcriptional regulator [Clostridium paraputrificum]|uniref:GntR family transcriptional regulator n=1 Tax=Clostridium TaxID=1485 RepID=UPI003D3490D1